MRKTLFLKLIFILALAVLNSGCEPKTETKSFLKVNIDDIETNDIQLSELVESCDLVLLETKTEALLNSSAGFAVSNDYILIVDYDQYPAKLFKRTGQFISDLGKIGAGPNEYMSVVSPYIDETNESFWLLLGGNYSNINDGWFYIFNKNGEIIQKIRAIEKDDNASNSNEVLVYDNQILTPGNVKSSNMIVYKSLNIDTVVTIANRIKQDYFTYLTNISTIYPVKDKFIFKIGEADTIYSYTPKSGLIHSVATIYSNKHRFDENKIKEARKTTGPGRFANIQNATENCYSIILLGETDKYYLLSVCIAGKESATKLLLVDKKSGEPSFRQIKNDFQTGAPLDKIPYFYQNKYVIFHYSAIEYLDIIRQQQKVVTDKKDILSLQVIADKLKNDDNDILMICKMR